MRVRSSSASLGVPAYSLQLTRRGHYITFLYIWRETSSALQQRNNTTTTTTTMTTTTTTTTTTTSIHLFLGLASGFL
jgi:hypothetical protein